MKWEQTGASLRRSLCTKFQRSREWFGNVCALGLESQRKRDQWARGADEVKAGWEQGVQDPRTISSVLRDVLALEP